MTSLTKPCSLPDQQVAHVRGPGHPGKVEHQVDVVVLVVRRLGGSVNSLGILVQ